MYRYNSTKELEFFIVHPGGPYFKNKDEGSWSIPKGEIHQGEEPFAAAQREFEEETGLKPLGNYKSLGDTRLKSGKKITAWAFEGDWDGLLLCQTNAKMEWPPNSGNIISFPEVDKAGFFTEHDAKRKLHPAQSVFIERLLNSI